MSTEVSAPAVREGLFTLDPPALLAGRCANCGALRFPTADVCATCQQREIERIALSPHGTVFTFTVVHAGPPGYIGETPYAFGVVELPEGLRITATLVAADLEQISVGNACAFELLPLGGSLSCGKVLIGSAA